MLAARDAHARVPIASMTKLMTVLVALEHAKLGDDGDGASRRRPASGESSIGLRAGERLTVARPRRGGADPERQRRGVRARGARRRRRRRRVRARDEREGTQAASPRHAVRPARRARCAGRALERCRRDAARAYRHARPAIRETVRRRSGTIAAAARCTRGTTCSATFPGLYGVKTGHTGGAGWCEVAAVRGRGYTIYATILGSPSREQRNAGLAALAQVGPLPIPCRERDREGRHVRARPDRLRPRPLRLVAASPRGARSASTGRSWRASSPRPAVELPVRAGQRLGTIRVYDGKRVLAARPLVAARAVSRPSLAARVGFYARRTAKHIWSWISST